MVKLKSLVKQACEAKLFSCDCRTIILICYSLCWVTITSQQRMSVIKCGLIVKMIIVLSYKLRQGLLYSTQPIIMFIYQQLQGLEHL